MSLSEIFIKNKGIPFYINGDLVVMSYKIYVTKNQQVKVEFISSKNDYRQGIEISVDKRTGYIEVNDQKLNSPVFWKDTAPTSFVFRCFPKKDKGQLNIWNIWQYTGQEERVDAWIGNAGINVNQEGEGTFLFHCSHGIGEIDFNDLVFRITLQ